MKSFKDFAKKIVVETTVPPELQHIAEDWHHHGMVDEQTKTKIDAATAGKGFAHFPLTQHTEVDVDPDVVEHLHNHGYRIKDYVKGIASTTKTVGNDQVGYKQKLVDERIGSVLEKTNAPLHVKSAFMNDANRQATKDHELHVCVTTRPLGIAGMTTGTAWHNQSCMNLETGSYAHKLRKDSEHGTHVAYLVKANDEGAKTKGEPDAPLARIAIKPYHSTTDQGFHHNAEHLDTIFRPEEKTYGANSSQFRNAVVHWTKTNYPAKEGVRYLKNESVYDDTGNEVHVRPSKADVEKRIDIGDVDVKGLDKGDMDHVINYSIEKHKSDPGKFSTLVKTISRASNLTNTQVHKLYSETLNSDMMGHVKTSTLNSLASMHGEKLSTAHVAHVIKQSKEPGGFDVPRQVLMSPKLSEEHIDTLHPNDYEFVNADKLKPKHIDKMVNSWASGNSGSAYPLYVHFNKLNGKHLVDMAERAMYGKVDSFITKMANHPEFSQEAHDKLRHAFYRGNQFQNEKNLMVNSPFAKVSEMGSHHPISDIANNKNIPESEQIKVKNYLVNKPSKWAKIPERISRHMTDDDYYEMSAHTKYPTFESVDHSNKFLDALHAHTKDLDEELSTRKKDLADEGHEHDYDPKIDDLHRKLNDHLEHYAGVLEDHIDKHLTEEDEEGHTRIKDSHEFNKARDRIDVLDDLENYHTHGNTNRSDETEHFDDHFHPLHQRLDRIKKWSEY